MAVPTFTKSGAKATVAAKLDKHVFGVEVKNHELLKQAYLAYLADGRAVSAKTKSRGQVRGGGAKPWRQKGTGRARFGSSRNPLWTGGGVAFGPQANRNFSKKINSSAKRIAIRQALTLAAQENRIMVIEALALATAKTKQAALLLSKLGVNRQVLLVVDDTADPQLKALKNLADTTVVSQNYLNVYDVLNADQLIITKPALAALEQRLGVENG